MNNILQTIVNNIVIIFTTITVTVTSFFTPSKPIPSPTPTPTTQQVLINDDITPTQTPLKGSSQKSITKQKVSPIPSIPITQTQTVIPSPDPKKVPDGIAPGAYSPDSLTQEQKQWLWKFYGHEGNAPFGYGGETYVPTRSYSGTSKACFTFYGETVSGDTYTKGKPIIFDASCSENAEIYQWYLQSPYGSYSEIMNDEGNFRQKTITKCYGCPPNTYSDGTHGTTEWKIKLQVGKTDYKPDSIEKIMKIKW